MTRPSFLTDPEYQGLIANGKLPVGQKDAFPGIFVHWGDERWFLHEITPDDLNIAIAIHYPSEGMMDLVRVPLDMLDNLWDSDGNGVVRGELGKTPRKSTLS